MRLPTENKHGLFTSPYNSELIIPSARDTLPAHSTRSAKRRKLKVAQTPLPYQIKDCLTACANRTLTFHSSSEAPVTITYEELYQRAQNIAAELQHHGVNSQEQTRVGICLERGINLIAAFFGVWLAGGTVVALETNPEYKPMIANKIKTAELTTFLYQQSTEILITGNGTSSEMKLIEINSAINSSQQYQTPNGITLETDAYIAFTSGSTGNPKGVLVAHGALNNLFLHTEKFLQEPAKKNLCTAEFLTTQNAVLINAEQTFDAFISELLLLLRTPFSHLIEESERRNPSFVEKIIEKNNINVTILTATLAAKINTQVLGKLMQMISMGSSPGNFLQELRDKYPTLLLRNEYGVTEAGIWNTNNPGNLDSIGQPIEGCQIVLLDPDLRVAQEGEIYLSGICLAKGYINNPEATAERFLNLAFNPETEQYYKPQPGETVNTTRFYKTGDRAAQLETGHLKILGRVENDLEIKLQDSRINLEAVSNAIKKHTSVSNAVVIQVKEIKNSPLFAAIELVQNKDRPSPQELRDFLAKEAIPFMAWPWGFSFETININNRGKEDIDTVTEIATTYFESKCKVSANSGPSEHEEKIKNLWLEILNNSRGEQTQKITIEEITPGTTFSELGADSLSYTTLLNRLNQHFGLHSTSRITMPEIFNTTPTEQSTLVLNKLETISTTPPRQTASEQAAFGFTESPSPFGFTP